MLEIIIRILGFAIGFIGYHGMIMTLIKEGKRYAIDVQLIFFASGLSGAALMLFSLLGKIK